MFVEACEKAAMFTRPAVISHRSLDGDVAVGVASFIVLNADGWIVTAGHLSQVLTRQQRDQPLIQAYDQEVALAQAEPEFNRRKKRLSRLIRDNEWIRNASIWWGADGVKVTEMYVYPPADIMICKLQGFEALNVAEFPRLKEPQALKAGMSLVKVGYPFHEIKGRWNEAKAAFEFDNTGIALFPIDGIFTREFVIIDTVNPNPPDYPVKILQTSTPGLMGQSGGPTLDRSGALCAIQSSTQHIPLGFHPKVKEGRREIEEYQFINVGMGIHTETLKALLEKHQIAVEWVA